jgi:hypothetical protein
MEGQAWRPSISINPQRQVSSEPLWAMELTNSRHFIAQRRNCGYDLGDEVGRRQRFDRGRRTSCRRELPACTTRAGFRGRGKFFIWIRCNPLKSPDPAKEKQGNPSFFVWFYLVFLAFIWIKLARRLY